MGFELGFVRVIVMIRGKGRGSVRDEIKIRFSVRVRLGGLVRFSPDVKSGMEVEETKALSKIKRYRGYYTRIQKKGTLDFFTDLTRMLVRCQRVLWLTKPIHQFYSKTGIRV